MRAFIAKRSSPSAPSAAFLCSPEPRTCGWLFWSRVPCLHPCPIYMLEKPVILERNLDCEIVLSAPLRRVTSGFFLDCFVPNVNVNWRHLVLYSCEVSFDLVGSNPSHSLLLWRQNSLYFAHYMLLLWSTVAKQSFMAGNWWCALKLFKILVLCLVPGTTSIR